MLEMVSMDHFSTLFAMCAEFFKTQQERNARVDSDSFRQWLQDELFPRLLEQSDKALTSIISLKANEKERFEVILGHLVAIRAAVAEPTAADIWHGLQPNDRSVLAQLYQKQLVSPDSFFDDDDLLDKYPRKDLDASLRYLDERGWVNLREYSGARSFDLKPAGVQLVWEAKDPTGYAQASTRLARCLPDARSAKRIGELAIEAEVPYPLVRALIGGWANLSLLTFDDTYSPPEAGVVRRVSETLRRTL